MCLYDNNKYYCGLIFFRLVYKWFLFLYKVSYGLGIIGYLIIMLTFMGANFVFQQPSDNWMFSGLLCIFYGLYIGILGRDISEICSDKMAATIGVRIKSIPLHFDCVCINFLIIILF